MEDENLLIDFTENSVFANADFETLMTTGALTGQITLNSEMMMREIIDEINENERAAARPFVKGNGLMHSCTPANSAEELTEINDMDNLEDKQFTVQSDGSLRTGDVTSECVTESSSSKFTLTGSASVKPNEKLAPKRDVCVNDEDYRITLLYVVKKYSKDVSSTRMKNLIESANMNSRTNDHEKYVANWEHIINLLKLQMKQRIGMRVFDFELMCDQLLYDTAMTLDVLFTVEHADGTITGGAKVQQKASRKFKTKFEHHSQNHSLDLNQVKILEMFDIMMGDNIHKCNFIRLAELIENYIDDHGISFSKLQLLQMHPKFLELNSQTQDVQKISTAFFKQPKDVMLTYQNPYINHREGLIRWDRMTLEEKCDHVIDVHVNTNDHHLRFENKDLMRDIERTMECMFDLWACALRYNTSIRGAYLDFHKWILTALKEEKKTGPQYQYLSFTGLCLFYSFVYNSGVTKEHYTPIYNAHQSRLKELSKDAIAFDWNKVLNSDTLKNLMKARIAKIPEIIDYKIETRLHVNAVNQFREATRSKMDHDKDKFNVYSMMAYTYYWIVKPKLDKQTTGTDNEEEEEGETSKAFPELEEMEKPLTDDEIKEAADEIPTHPAIKNLLKQASDYLGAKYQDFKLATSNILTNLLGSAFDFEGIIRIMKDKILGFASSIYSALDIGDVLDMSLNEVGTLLVCLVLFLNVESLWMKGIAIVVALKTLGIFERMVSVFKKLFNTPDVTPNSMSFDKQTAGTDFITKFIEVFSGFDKFDVVKASTFLSVIIVAICGLAYLPGNVTELGKQFVEYMKNWNFVGLGFLGIARTYQYIFGGVKFVMEWFGKTFLNFLPKEEEQKKMVDDFVTQYSTWSMTVDATTLETSLSSVASDDQIRKQIFELWAQAARIERLYQSEDFLRKPTFRPRWQSLMDKLNKAVNLVIKVQATDNFRMTPFHIQLTGEQGIGKSTLVKGIVDAMNRAFWPNSTNNLYAFNMSTDHMDGYHGQKIVVIDDMFPANDYQLLVPWLALISNCPVRVPMAALEEKNTYFTSELVISTTNTPYPEMTGWYKKENIFRRRHLLVHVTVDKEVMSPNTGAFDPVLFETKYKGQDSQTFPHLKFTFKNPIKDEILRDHLPEGLIKPVEDLTYTEFMNRINTRMTAFRKGEQKFQDGREQYKREIINKVHLLNNEAIQNCKNKEKFDGFAKSFYDCVFDMPTVSSSEGMTPPANREEIVNTPLDTGTTDECVVDLPNIEPDLTGSLNIFMQEIDECTGVEEFLDALCTLTLTFTIDHVGLTINERRDQFDKLCINLVKSLEKYTNIELWYGKKIVKLNLKDKQCIQDLVECIDSQSERVVIESGFSKQNLEKYVYELLMARVFLIALYCRQNHETIPTPKPKGYLGQIVKKFRTGVEEKFGLYVDKQTSLEEDVETQLLDEILDKYGNFNLMEVVFVKQHYNTLDNKSFEELLGFNPIADNIPADLSIENCDTVEQILNAVRTLAVTVYSDQFSIITARDPTLSAFVKELSTWDPNVTVAHIHLEKIANKKPPQEAFNKLKEAVNFYIKMGDKIRAINEKRRTLTRLLKSGKKELIGKFKSAPNLGASLIGKESPVQLEGLLECEAFRLSSRFPNFVTIAPDVPPQMDFSCNDRVIPPPRITTNINAKFRLTDAQKQLVYGRTEDIYEFSAIFLRGLRQSKPYNESRSVYNKEIDPLDDDKEYWWFKRNAILLPPIIKTNIDGRMMKVRPTPASYLLCCDWFQDDLAQFYELTSEQKEHLVYFYAQSAGWIEHFFNYTSRIETKSITLKKKIIEYAGGSIKAVWNFCSMWRPVLTVLGGVCATSYVIWQLSKIFGNEQTSVTNFRSHYKPIGLDRITTDVKQTTGECVNLALRSAMARLTIGSTNSQGIKICSQTLLVPGHFVTPHMAQEYFVLNIHLNEETVHGYNVSADNIFLFEDLDLALIVVREFPNWKDIRSFFMQDGDFNKEMGRNVHMIAKQDDGVEYGCFPYHGITSVNTFRFTINSATRYGRMASYKVDVPRGYSGSMILNFQPGAQHKRVILGIQLVTNSREGLSFCSTLHQEMLNDVVTAVHKKLKIPYLSGPLFEPKSEEVDSSLSIQTSAMIALGTLDEKHSVNVSGRSDIIPTPLYPYMDVKRMPAILSARDARTIRDPALKSLHKHGKDSIIPLDPIRLNSCVQEIATYLKSKVGDIKVTTMQRAVEGWNDACGQVPHINVKKSPGLPYTMKVGKDRGKTDWIKINEDGTAWIHEDIQKEVDEWIKQYKDGIVPQQTFLEVMKDELRPIHKALGLTKEQWDDILEHKIPLAEWRTAYPDRLVNTRTITVLNMVITIIYRMYFTPLFAKMYQLANGVFPYCVGMNPESIHSTNAFMKARELNTKGFDIDVANWDGHYPPQLAFAAVDLINEVFKDKKENQDLRFTLVFGIMFGYVQYRNQLFSKPSGIPSGFPGTADINTLGHWILGLYQWKEMCIENGYEHLANLRCYLTLVLDLFYGDDRFTVPSVEIEHWFNGTTVAEKYRQYGWPTTCAAKDGKDEGLRPIEELQFLKRRWIYVRNDPTYVRWALEPETIYNLACYIRKTKEPHMQFKINLLLSLDYAADHGKIFFDDWKGQLNNMIKLANKNGARIDLLVDSYEDWLATKRARFFNEQSERRTEGSASLTEHFLEGIFPHNLVR